MTELFSADWMKQFQQAWNSEPEMVEPLAKAGFNSVIGYGYTDQDKPSGYIGVENGKVTSAGSYSAQTLNWDLRASKQQWQEWLSKDVGLTTLGAAVTMGRLNFKKGEYASMIKNPGLAGPFIKSFNLMGRMQMENA